MSLLTLLQLDLGQPKSSSADIRESSSAIVGLASVQIGDTVDILESQSAIGATATVADASSTDLLESSTILGTGGKLQHADIAALDSNVQGVLLHRVTRRTDISIIRGRHKPPKPEVLPETEHLATLARIRDMRLEALWLSGAITDDEYFALRLAA